MASDIDNVIMLLCTPGFAHLKLLMCGCKVTFKHSFASGDRGGSLGKYSFKIIQFNDKYQEIKPNFTKDGKELKVMLTRNVKEFNMES